MSLTGRRPRLELRGAAATPEEAAAVMAAVEQFLRDTAPPPAPAPARPSPWLRAARLEAVETDAERVPWGGEARRLRQARTR